MRREAGGMRKSPGSILLTRQALLSSRHEITTVLVAEAPPHPLGGEEAGVRGLRFENGTVIA